MKRSLAFIVFLFCLVCVGPVPAQTAPLTAIPGTIAYVDIQGVGGAELRLVEPDGSDDRLVVTVPRSPIDSIPALAWRPDATELAFSSDHGAETSLYGKDLYVVRPDGRGLRQLTNGPLPGQRAGYAKGTVTVDVFLAPGAKAPLLVYVAGAEQPQLIYNSGTLTFSNVPDYGPGIVQGVVGISGTKRWYSVGGDVEAGKTVKAGQLTISGPGRGRNADYPAYSHDGEAIGFVAGESCGEYRTISSTAQVNDLGTSKLTAGSFFALICLADWGPTPATANKLVYNEVDNQVRAVYMKNGDEPAKQLFSYSIYRLLVDIKWIPDGTGFIVAFLEYNGGTWTAGNLHEFSFATGRLRQITAFTDALTGNFSISPDSQWIVFERAASTEDYTDLWLIHRDGSDLKLLTRNGSRPAWSQVKPTAPPRYELFLPKLRR